MKTRHTDGGKTFVRSTGKKKKINYELLENYPWKDAYIKMIKSGEKLIKNYKKRNAKRN